MKIFEKPTLAKLNQVGDPEHGAMDDAHQLEEAMFENMHLSLTKVKEYGEKDIIGRVSSLLAMKNPKSYALVTFIKGMKVI